MGWKTLDDLDLNGKTVLTRVDINVPMADGAVTDATRIERIVPTVKTIIAQGGKPVLLAHFGRPKGKPVPDMSLRHVQPALEDHLGVPVTFAEDCVGVAAQAAVDALSPGTVLLLENTRFHAEEEANDANFAAQIAELGDIYCNDAFSAAHRAHASTEAIAHKLPSCAGRLMQAELEALDAALGNPERPVLAVVGGAKVSTKLELLHNLIDKVDTLVIGGGMANTFLFANGIEIGTSLAEKDMATTAKNIVEKAAAKGCEIILPKDIVVAREFKAGAANETLPVDQCPTDAMILDAGPETVALVENKLAGSKTVVWNGPFGAFEIPPFDAATKAAAQTVAKLTQDGKLTSVAGGGDTVAALNAAGAADHFTYVSTAGGAFLEWMEGKTLPGVAALSQ
ncbi:phosphoglycerate kinase [Qingshengfaniella alkalisoli]|uniref:Phosphoglycerate kinase n=1 Tax=Qingshengfaniella alkalisoli TaxID=2599296 RepID=A0A5B8ITF4_9RHOB|nr:phosphoglycerate kinase [Qingshengfaniella alkalisoli]QDY68723.1 phosphoglycerate kinase [Qingshengfaniella alkalisoli]